MIYTLPSSSLDGGVWTILFFSIYSCEWMNNTIEQGYIRIYIYHCMQINTYTWKENMKMNTVVTYHIKEDKIETFN